MTSPTELRYARRCGAAILAFSSLAACGFDESLSPHYGDTGTGSTLAPSYLDGGVSGYKAPAERSYVTPRGDIIFTKPRETTIVGRDGGVTVVQRDRDGTRTIVGSNGVQVIPARGGYRRR